MLREFKAPEEIKDYGRMVGDFSESSKQLARALRGLDVAQDDILHVVGRGRYNTVEQQGYVIYGPEATTAAKKNMQGLFGAFYYVHKPELQLSQQAPILLGKAGCKLVAVLEDGKKAEFPLERVGFDFIPQTERERGKITVRSDVDAVQPDGKTATLKAGTILTTSRLWVKKGGVPQFDIVDAKGKSLEEGSATIMLWGHLGSMGFKAQGLETSKFRTLARDGVDDDFTAERHMINWLNSFKIKNGIDLMPEFNNFVQAAHDSLASKPELLASFTSAAELSNLAQVAYKATMKLPTKAHRMEFEMGQMQEAERGITGAANMLGLELPPISSSPVQMVVKHNVGQALAKAVEEINESKRAQTREILKYEWRTFVEQCDDPFSDKWPNGTGNVLKNPQRLSLKDARMLKLLGEDIEAGHLVGKLTADNLQADARTKIVREFAKMSQFLEQAKLDAQGISLRPNTMFQGADAKEAFNTSLSAARSAIKGMLHAVKDGKPIEDLAGKVETIRGAYHTLNGAYGVHLPVAEKPTLPSPPVLPASHTLSRKETLAQRHIQSSAAKARNHATKRLKENTRQYWVEKRSGTFERFLNLMDAVGCDESKWMSLYRDTSALVQSEQPHEQQGFMGRIAAEQATKNEAGLG